MQAESWIQLNRNDKTSLHLQIYFRIKQAILHGKLIQGARLPSTRALASEINVSRGTIEIAYDMLSGEGLLQGKGPAGSFVSATAILSNAMEQSVRKPMSQPNSEIEGLLPASLMPLHPCVPAFDLFPKKLWAKLTHKRMREMAAQDLAQGNQAGYEPLRLAICNYLQLSRGVFCSPEQVFVTRGFQGALDLLTRTILEAGDNVVVEDPGYRYARNLFLQANMHLLYAPVDQEGMDVNWVQNNATPCKLVSVTPSHQSPTGVTLSITRRMALLEFARKQNAWILEDDYDSEYRYVGKPLPSLKSLDVEERVIYAGTFSKVLFPALRAGYIVVPQSLVSSFASASQIFQSGCQAMTQMVISDFINQGHFSRHIRKMRTQYNQRRQWLINALHEVFKQDIKIELQKSGMHLIVSPNLGMDDFVMADTARKAGLGIHALSEWSIHSDRKGLLIGFTNIENPEIAYQLVTRLKNLLS
jgi:GntR family transcriptional regulator / MocR family aminotransferase